eukprot:6679918-Prymnesium_polylepis.1
MLNSGFATIDGGSLISGSSATNGAALYLLGGDVVIDHSVIRSNRAGASGGALDVTGGSLLVTNGSSV